ncbi:hypothetical protein OIV83_000188 [Microbotryomycetes sp. JL201]|nr:hypothetical protein OIV83_000188 [Microbotryomycetes sp. JL201]
MSSFKLKLSMPSSGSSNGTAAVSAAAPSIAPAAAQPASVAPGTSAAAPVPYADARAISSSSAWPSTASNSAAAPADASSGAAAASTAPAATVARTDALAQHPHSQTVAAHNAGPSSKQHDSRSRSQQGAQESADAAREHKHEKEARGVSAHKYRSLKRNYNEMARSRADFALYSAQKLVHQLRKEKQALLDRVLHLETAANITSSEVAQAHVPAKPELYPPSLPQGSTRLQGTVAGPKKTDIRNISTELAVQQLSRDEAAQKRARVAPPSHYPTLAALGLLPQQAIALSADPTGQAHLYAHARAPSIQANGASASVAYTIPSTDPSSQVTSSIDFAPPRPRETA